MSENARRAMWSVYDDDGRRVAGPFRIKSDAFHAIPWTEQLRYKVLVDNEAGADELIARATGAAK